MHTQDGVYFTGQDLFSIREPTPGREEYEITQIVKPWLEGDQVWLKTTEAIRNIGNINEHFAIRGRAALAIVKILKAERQVLDARIRNFEAQV